MSKNVQIASVFTALGFKVDVKDLNLLQKRLGGLKKQLTSLQKDFRKIAQVKIESNGVQKVVTDVKNLNRELSKVKDKSFRITQANRAANTAKARAGGFVANGAGAAGGAASKLKKGPISALLSFVGALTGGKALFNIAAEYERLQTGLAAVTGSVSAATKELDFLKKTSNDLGLNFLTSGDSFKKLLASGKEVNFSSQNSQSLFTGVSEYSRVLGLSNETQKRMVTALSQMLSKGTVQSEELKQQLGDALPGAVGMMAKAVSSQLGRTVTVAELMDLMKDGAVSANAVLPHFAKILSAQARKGGALDRAKSSPLAEATRRSNAQDMLMIEMANGNFLTSVTKLNKALTELMNNSTKIASALGSVFGGLLGGIGTILSGLSSIDSRIWTVIGAAAGIAAAIFAPFVTLGVVVVWLLGQLDKLKLWMDIYGGFSETIAAVFKSTSIYKAVTSLTDFAISEFDRFIDHIAAIPADFVDTFSIKSVFQNATGFIGSGDQSRLLPNGGNQDRLEVSLSDDLKGTLNGMNDKIYDASHYDAQTEQQ